MISGKDIVQNFIASDISADIIEAENSILSPVLGELSRIENKDIRNFVRALLLKSKAFWYAPSSSDSIFYPPDESFPGGLVVHTQRVFRAAEILASIYDLPNLEVDKLKAAAILHDITKFVDSSVEQGYAEDYLHPYTVDALYRYVAAEDGLNTDDSQSNVLAIDKAIVEDILSYIRSHKGINSPIPETIPSKASIPMLLHVANEIAKSLPYIIDGESIVIERWLTKDGEPE